MLEFRVLGSLGLVHDDGREARSVLSQPKRTALLAYLATARPGPLHRRDSLLVHFWPESDEEHARNALNQALHKLRRSLGPGVIESRGREEVGIAEGGLWCDARAFGAALEEGDPERALELYRGEFLEGLHLTGVPEFERWLDRERGHLRRHAREAAVELADAQDDARRWLERALEIVPADEAVARRLMDVLDRMGDRAGALRAYENLARDLKARFGTSPGPETERLAERVRGDGRGAASPTAAAPELAEEETRGDAEPATESGPAPESERSGGPQHRTRPRSANGDAAVSPEAGEAPADGRSSLRGSLAPRRAMRRAAVTLVVLSLGGYAAFETLGPGFSEPLLAGGALEPGSTLVLADFEGADSALAATVTAALRIDLEQSSALTLLSPELRQSALERMGREPGAPLPLAVARELARREGLKGAIGGAVRTAGEAQLLTARLLPADGGRPPISERERVEGPRDVVDAIDRLSGKLRKRLGESVESIRASPPLARVTTPSLEALTLYTGGLRAYDAGDNRRAAALLEGAVEEDSAFAMAHRKLGVALGALGRFAEASEAFRRAYVNRDRATELERTEIAGVYLYMVEGDPERAAREWEDYLARHPERGGFHNLAHAYLNLGRHERAEEIELGLIEAQGGSWSTVASARLAQGRLDDAAEAVRRIPASATGRFQQGDAGNLAYARRRYERADSIYRAGDFLYYLASLRSVRGRLAEADSVFREMIRQRPSRFGLAGRVRDGLARARVRLHAAHDTIGALEIVRRVLDEVGADSLEAWELPHGDLSVFFALAGETEAARRHLVRSEEAVEARGGDPVVARLWRRTARGTLALSEGRPEGAVQHLRAALDVPAAIECGGEACLLPLLARTYRELGETMSELEVLERYEAAHNPWRVDWDGLFLGSAYERLAALYDKRGEPARAAEYYGRLVALWKDADAQLQPRVRSARQRLQRIAVDRAGGAPLSADNQGTPPW